MQKGDETREEFQVFNFEVIIRILLQKEFEIDVIAAQHHICEMHVIGSWDIRDTYCNLNVFQEILFSRVMRKL